eukprot:178942_1
MTQLANEKNALSYLLKLNEKGWKIELFEDQNTIKSCLVCKGCSGVCREAVELGCDSCDHDDADIYPFCTCCLATLIEEHGQKCPINAHSDPIICPNRSIRRQVLKATVYCPYSIKFQQQLNYENRNSQIIDTIGSDEKEGAIDNNVIYEGCNWNGNIPELIANHLSDCVKQYDPVLTQSFTISKLQKENAQLKQIVQQQQNEIMALKMQNETIITKKTAEIQKLTKQNEDLSSELFALRTVNINQQPLKSRENVTGKKIAEDVSELKQAFSDLYNLVNVVDQEEKEEKKLVDEPKLKFHTNGSNALYFNVEDNGDTVHWKGGFNAGGLIMVGNFLKNKQKTTIYFKIPTVGNADKYSFGFVTPKQTSWGNDRDPKHGRMVRCDGLLEGSNKNFLKLSNKVPILYDKSLDFNVIGMCLDMQQRIGCVWNKNNPDIKARLSIPAQERLVGIVVGFHGTDKKKATVISVEENIQNDGLYFCLNSGNASNFKLEDEDKTAHWQGGLNDGALIMLGNFVGANDARKVLLKMPTKGTASKYVFGFVTPQQSRWINYRSVGPKYGLLVEGDAKLITNCEKFELINTTAVFDESWDQNIIGISVDMKQKTGCVWNEMNNEAQCNIKFAADVSNVGIVIGFHGTDKKKATVISVEENIQNDGLYFCLNSGNASNFKLEDEDKTAHWQGGLNDGALIMLGNFVGANDARKVLLKMPTKGTASKYVFGFVTPQQSRWINYRSVGPKYGLLVEGDAKLITNCEKFELINTTAVFDESWDQNIIGISVDMKQKKLGVFGMK